MTQTTSSSLAEEIPQALLPLLEKHPAFKKLSEAFPSLAHPASCWTSCSLNTESNGEMSLSLTCVFVDPLVMSLQVKLLLPVVHLDSEQS